MANFRDGSRDPHEHFITDPDFKFLARMIAILEVARLEKGFSERHLSRLANVPNGSIRRAEKLERLPGVVFLRRWARALEIDWGELSRRADAKD